MKKQPMHPNFDSPDKESASPHIPVVYEDEEYYWQYKYIRQNMNEEEPLDESRLNKLGKEGWELVTVFIHDDKFAHYYFKRLES